MKLFSMNLNKKPIEKVINPLDGLKSGTNAFYMFNKQNLKKIIDEKLPDATMFSSVTQGDFYWKFDEDGYLCHNDYYNKSKGSNLFNTWVRTKYSSILMAKSAGVVDIYNLIELEEFYDELI